MKNYLFFTKDGFTFDQLNQETNNMQLLGDGMGDSIEEALINFKDNQPYISKFKYYNIMAIQTIGPAFMNLEL